MLTSRSFKNGSSAARERFDCVAATGTGVTLRHTIANEALWPIEVAPWALTILRGYCAAGRPAQGFKPWGSFEQWSDLVRGAIVWAGEPDPADTREELRAENDTTGQALVGLVEGWRAVAKRYGGACTARQALDELARNESSANGGNEPLRYEGLRSALGDLIRVLPGKPPTTHQIGVLLRRFRSKPVRCSDGSRLALMQPKTRRALR